MTCPRNCITVTDLEAKDGKNKNGDTVRVHYTGKLGDGTVFDTSIGRAPLEFTLGKGGVIPGFDHAVLGMDQGESVTTKVSADNAYGPRCVELVLVVDRGQFPADVNPRLVTSSN